MSKQRPYDTFEEAYILQMLSRIPEALDEFILELIYFKGLSSKTQTIPVIRMHFTYCNIPIIKEYWNCLCHMYGKSYVYAFMNYILTENIDLCIDHVIDLIKRSFPPTWDYGEEPVLSLCQINFIELY